MPGMNRAIFVVLHLAAAAAMVRGLAAFDAGPSAADNQPIASAILFVGGLLTLVQLRASPTVD